MTKWYLAAFLSAVILSVAVPAGAVILEPGMPPVKMTPSVVTPLATVSEFVNSNLMAGDVVHALFVGDLMQTGGKCYVRTTISGDSAEISITDENKKLIYRLFVRSAFDSGFAVSRSHDHISEITQSSFSPSADYYHGDESTSIMASQLIWKMGPVSGITLAGYYINTKDANLPAKPGITFICQGLEKLELGWGK